MLACAAVRLAAQPELPEVRIRSGIYAPPGLVISVQSNLVEVPVTVRDAGGRPVHGLRAADFHLLDNGTQQEITAFSEIGGKSDSRDQATVRAHYVALFFDDFHTDSVNLHRAKLAAEGLVRDGMRTGDRMGVFTDSGAVTEDFTTDKTALLAALERLAVHSSASHPMSPCPVLGVYEAYAISRHLDFGLKQRAVSQAVACNCPPPSSTDTKGKGGDPDYEACVAQQDGFVQNVAESIWDIARPQSEATIETVQMLVRHLARMPGARILVLVSSGFPSGGTDRAMNGVVETALRSHVVIDALHAEGLLTDRNLPRQLALTEFLGAAADSTGGELIENTNDFNAGLRTLAEPPAGSYVLGFSPSSEPDDKVHNLKLKIGLPGAYQLKSRHSYFAETVKKTETVQQRIDREAQADEARSDFPAVVAVAPSGQQVRVEVRVDIQSLEFLEQNGRHLQQLTFVTVLRDSEGKYVGGRQAVMDLALTPAKLASMRAMGIRATISLPAPKGAFQVREIVREAAQNRMAISTTAVGGR